MGLAARIRRARRIAGISQQALAHALGVTRSAVSNWEADGGVSPATDRLVVLARTLHVAFEWLATGRGEMAVGGQAARVAGTLEDDTRSQVHCPHELNLLQAYRRAPPRVKALLHEMADLHAPWPRRKPSAQG